MSDKMSNGKRKSKIEWGLNQIANYFGVSVAQVKLVMEGVEQAELDKLVVEIKKNEA